MVLHSCASACLLVFSVIYLCASYEATSEPERVDLDLLDVGTCMIGGTDKCDEQGLSLRQLRGEPVHAIEQQSEGQKQPESSATSDSELQSEDEGSEELQANAATGWGWQTWTISADTSQSGWAWDVVRVKFLTTTNQELSPSTPGCHLVDSGHADTPGYGPLNAFTDDKSWWGGRKDGFSRNFFLGITCHGAQKIAAVQLEQLGGDHFAHHVQVFHNHRNVETKRVGSASLQTIWAGSIGLRLVGKGLKSGWSWDVRRLKIVLPADHSIGFPGGELRPNLSHPFNCRTVESGHVDTPGYEPSNAFDDHGSWWGGRPDAAHHFYIGVKCDSPFKWPEAHDVYLDQFGDHYATEVAIQELTVFGWSTKARVHVGPGGLLPLL